MTISITEHTEGCVVAVRAQPGARKNGVQGEQNGMLKIATTAPPEDGRANDAITDILREWLGVKRSQVELIGGPTSREKKFLVRGVDVEVLKEMIDARLK